MSTAEVRRIQKYDCYKIGIKHQRQLSQIPSREFYVCSCIVQIYQTNCAITCPIVVFVDKSIYFCICIMGVINYNL